MALVCQPVLVFAADVPGLDHQLAALTHRQAGARFDHGGQHRLQVARPQSQPRLHAFAKTAAARAAQQALLKRPGIHHRRVAEVVDPGGNAGVDLAERNLVGDQDGRLQAGAAGALYVEPRRLRIQSGRQQRFACQVVVLGMLDHRAGDHIAEPLALQIEALDQRAQGCGQQLLVVGAGVGGVRACERGADPADDGYASGSGSDLHGMPLRVSLRVSATRPRPSAALGLAS